MHFQNTKSAPGIAHARPDANPGCEVFAERARRVKLYTMQLEQMGRIFYLPRNHDRTGEPEPTV